MFTAKKVHNESCFTSDAISSYAGRIDFEQETKQVAKVVAWLNQQPEVPGLFAQYGIVLEHISQKASVRFFQLVYMMIYDTPAAFKLASYDLALADNVYAEIDGTTYPMSVVGYVFQVVNACISQPNSGLELLVLPNCFEI